MSSPEELQFFDTGLATFIGAAGREFQGGALWQNDASKALLLKWTATLKRFRAVLNGDIVHVLKPSGRKFDALLHVLPSAAPGEPKGFALFYNPSTTAAANVSTALSVYYCGFDAGASVAVEWDTGDVEHVVQDAFFNLRLSRSVPPLGYAWAALS